MIRLLLARHGNTFESGQTPTQVGAKTDLPLTAQGQKQAEQIAVYLLENRMSPAAIYTGPLKRQKETAEIIANRLKMKILPEIALTEIDYGPWEGLTSEEIAARWKREYADWVECGHWPEKIFGGSYDLHLQQIDHWLGLLRKTHSPGETVLAVSSNGLIRFFNKENRDLLAATRQMEMLKVKTGHLCEFEIHPKSLHVLKWNLKP